MEVPVDPRRQGELDFAVVELLDVGSPTLVGWDLFNTDYLNRGSPGAVSSTHVTIALGDSSGHRHVPVLPVHVVGATTGVVPQPHAEVLDFHRSLVVNPTNGDDLRVRLLHFLQLAGEVPVAGLGNYLVRSENHHLVQGGVLVLFGWQMPPDDFILLKQTAGLHFAGGVHRKKL